MAERVEVEVDELSLNRTLENLEKIKMRAEHPRQIFERARVMLGVSFADNFAQAGLPSGGWSPLDARYAAWKSVHYPGAPMMVQTGSLLADLTTLRNTASRILDSEAEFGTSVEYAKFHQYGTTKMAKRKVIFEPPLFAESLGQQLSQYVVDGTIPG